MDFIGRVKELAGLEKQYESDKFEFSVIYGRRRVGKTWLIQKFIEDRTSIYYMGIEAGTSSNLQSLSREVHRFTGSEGMAPWQTYEDLFHYLAMIAKDRRIVFVIDEFPYLAASAPEVSSLIQKFCDHEWKASRLHLILCGSSMSFMEHQVLGAKSPLYGRRTAQYRLMPFTFFETFDYLAPMHKEDAAIIHCATGGIAEYLSHVDKSRSLEENLISLFFESSGRLYEEPSNLLKQELREPRVYNDILDAMAKGSSKSNEIATRVNMQSGALNRYIESLSELGIIRREKPIGNEAGRKTIYMIQDGCFRFWYRFVMPNQSAIMSGLGGQVYEKVVKPALPEFMGQGFEDIFFDHFDRWNHDGILPDLVTKRGRWWGNNPIEHREEEIDLVGIGTQTTFFGEAKWRNEKTGIEVIQSLEKKSSLIKSSKRYYLLFSKSGFTKSIVDFSKNRNDILLFTFLDENESAV